MLVTSHLHPDPDAIGSAQAMAALLRALLPAGTVVDVRFRGQIGGGINQAFTRVSHLDHLPWDDEALATYDAVALVDTQPGFANSPLPGSVVPTVIVDHHRGRGRRAKAAFADIRIKVGATASILFSYFMEAKLPIPPGLAATMLYAIESDLSGVAGQQGGLDTIAISSLTLLADTKRLYAMRYVDVPQGYYGAFAETVKHAMRHDGVIVSHLNHVDYAETTGVMADWLLRCEGVHWTFVSAVHDGRFVFSLRTKLTNKSAGEIARRIADQLGDGGGHLTKAGGAIYPRPDVPLDSLHARVTKRLLRCLQGSVTRGTKLA